MKEMLRNFISNYLKNKNAKYTIVDALSEFKKEYPQIRQDAKLISMFDEVLKENANIAETKYKDAYMKEAELAAKTRKEEDIKNANPILYKYCVAKYEQGLGNYDVARDTIEEAIKIMKNDVTNENSFVKLVFGELIEKLNDELNY